MDETKDGTAQLGREHLKSDELTHAEAIFKNKTHAEIDDRKRHELLEKLG
jgi:hypothetical protein